MHKYLLFFLLFFNLLSTDVSAGDVKKGFLITQAFCARCHVLPNSNKFGGIDSTLSLQGLRALPDWRQRFKTFFARRPHLAFVQIGKDQLKNVPATYAEKIKLAAVDLEHIVAFVATLSPR